MMNPPAISILNVISNLLPSLIDVSINGHPRSLINVSINGHPRSHISVSINGRPVFHTPPPLHPNVPNNSKDPLVVSSLSDSKETDVLEIRPTTCGELKIGEGTSKEWLKRHGTVNKSNLRENE